MSECGTKRATVNSHPVPLRTGAEIVVRTGALGSKFWPLVISPVRYIIGKKDQSMQKSVTNYRMDINFLHAVFLCNQLTWGQMLRSWHETQEFEFLQFCLCLMCAYNVPDVCTYLMVLITWKYGPRRYQRRVARHYTTKARFCGSILNMKQHGLKIQELFKSFWASSLKNVDHQRLKFFQLL